MRIFKWLGKALLGASAALLVGNVAFAAQESDNSMPMNQLPQGGSEINQLRSTGFIPFSKTELKEILQESGFAFSGETDVDDGKGIIIVTVAQKQPFIFLLLNCEGDSCMFLKMIHLIDTPSAGMYFTPAQAADLTKILPFGFLAVKDSSSPLGLIYGSPMMRECARACLVSKIGMFVANASATHRMLSVLRDNQRNSASLDPKALADNITRTYHYETLRVESGMRASQLTGMDNFLGSMAMKASFAPASLDAIDLADFATNHGVSNLGGVSESALAVMHENSGPLIINEVVLPMEFKPLFPSD
jgi:hypothetical protein